VPASLAARVNDIDARHLSIATPARKSLAAWPTFALQGK
jgi:hypothetical protein